jgi:hypothetical protein
MAMIPYMAAGYVADRAMGGNGMTGLAIGTGVGGLGTGTFAGALGSEAATAGMTNTVASNAAANSFPTILGSMPTAEVGVGAVNPLTTGGFSESISPFTQLGGAGVGGNVGFLGQPISNQVMNSSLTGEKGLLGYGLENTMIGDGFDSLTGTINDGYENMSFMDKVGTAQMGGQVIDATNQPPPQLQVRPPQSKPAKEPTISSPLAINVQEPNTNFVKDPRKLYEERYGYA